MTDPTEQIPPNLPGTAAWVHEAVTIVRDLAAATRDVDVAGVQSRAREWTRAHDTRVQP